MPKKGYKRSSTIEKHVRKLRWDFCFLIQEAMDRGAKFTKKDIEAFRSVSEEKALVTWSIDDISSQVRWENGEWVSDENLKAHLDSVLDFDANDGTNWDNIRYFLYDDVFFRSCRKPTKDQYWNEKGILMHKLKDGRELEIQHRGKPILRHDWDGFIFEGPRDLDDDLLYRYHGVLPIGPDIEAERAKSTWHPDPWIDERFHGKKFPKVRKSYKLDDEGFYRISKNKIATTVDGLMLIDAKKWREARTVVLNEK